MIKCRNLFFISISICLILCSCKKTGITDEAAVPGTTTVNKTALIQLVNDVRQRGCTCGTTFMPPVGVIVWNTELEVAAQSHSKEMQSNNYFSHTGLDGSTPGDRIRLAGYSWRKYGENIAKGYSTEQEVINAWLQSEDHCKNLMDADFKEMGVARAGLYWTQEFGLR